MSSYLYVKHVIYPFGPSAGRFFAREKLFQARETRYQPKFGSDSNMVGTFF